MPGIEFWTEGWAVGRTFFHEKSVNNLLLQYQDKLLVKKPSRVLVPLCGKTLDMKWLADMGHEVVGVECVPQAVKEFFHDQGLAFQESDVKGLEGATLYQTEDGRIKLFVCDFFKFSRDFAGEFDAVWDRASLTAIDPCDRQKYVDVIQSVVAPGGHILHETLHYDFGQRKRKGPPFPSSEEDIKGLYGENFNIELVTDNDLLSLQPEYSRWGVTWLRQHVYHMVAKF